MNNMDILQWVVMAIFAAIGLVISLRKLGSERMSLDGSGAESFAQAAKTYADENIALRKEISEMKKRLDKVEKKKYRITINFEIGDPPSVGVVTIEPILELAGHIKEEPKKKLNN